MSKSGKQTLPRSSQEQGRFRKASRWLNAEVTADKLAAVAVPMRMVLSVMGFMFTSESRYIPTPQRSMLVLLGADSPAKLVVKDMLALLGNQRDPVWKVLALNDEAWNSRLYLLAAVPIWIMVGQIMKRFIFVLDETPWSLAALFGDVLTDERKQALAASIFWGNECCLDRLTLWLRSQCIAPQQMLEPEFLSLIQAMFAQAPVCNVHSENRFSKSTRHAKASNGNHANHYTVSSCHVLDETKTVLDTFLWLGS